MPEQTMMRIHDKRLRFANPMVLSPSDPSPGLPAVPGVVSGSGYSHPISSDAGPDLVGQLWCRSQK